MPRAHRPDVQVFAEIGIIDQLATTRIDRLLPDGISSAQFSVLNHLAVHGREETPASLAETFVVTKAQALIAGYETRRPLTADEKAMMPLLAHGAAMRFFLTRLADWAKPAGDALVRPHNPMEYERKLAVHRAGLDFFGAV